MHPQFGSSLEERNAYFRQLRLLQGPYTDGIPDDLWSTVKMLRQAFPSDIAVDTKDYDAVCAFLDHEVWPHRAIAHAFDFAFDLGYVTVLNVMGGIADEKVRAQELSRMECLFLPLGLNAWRKENRQEGNVR
jgi:hypothetical protein